MQNILAGWKIFRARCNGRLVAIGIFAVLVAAVALWILSRVKTVRINQNGDITVLHTALSSPADILEREGIELKSSDKVTVSGFEAGFFGSFGEPIAEIHIQSAVHVSILADKKTYHVTVAEGDTLGDALYTAGLTVRATDYLDKAAEKVAEPEECVRLTRVDYITTTEEETIPHGSATRGSSLVKEGRTVLLSYGKDGTLLKTYEQKVVDGVEEDRVLISEDVIKKPVDDLYLEGDGSAVSPLDYGAEFDGNGVPTGYVKLYENVRATGYYAPYGSGTASGRRAQVGYVAVDPKVIPYGTKLWICGHGSSKFVYGYALAADTGGAMLSGKNFVDLYYDTYRECVLNGLKYVDVYVLE